MQHLSRHGESKGQTMTRSQLQHLIDERIIGRNAERNRQIITRRLIDGVTYDKLAEEFDMSVRQIKNIVYRCSDILLG